MLRGFGIGFILAAVLSTAAPALADTPSPPAAPAAPFIEADIKLPPGTRRDVADGSYVAGRGLRDSTEHIAKQLARAGIVVEQVGPYRVRGIELTRFLSQSPSTRWMAIHVLRSAGKTRIFFVPRAGA